MNFPTTLELSIGDIRMPFSDDIKYSILGISVLLLAVALGILAWQVYRYCTQKPRWLKQWNSLLSREDGSTQEAVYGSNVQRPEAKSKPQAVENLLEDTSRPSQHPSPEDSGGVGGLLTPEDSDSVTGPPSPEDSDRFRGLPSPENSGGVGDPPSPCSPQEVEQPQAQGSLCFSLQYDQLQARLQLTVLGARALGGSGSSGSMDPLVRVRLLWAGPKDTPTSPPLHCVLREWQTRAVTDSSNPAFGDQFSCSLPERDLPHVTVRLEVRDFNKHSRHEILGEVRAHLGGLDLSYPLEIQEDLQPAKKDQVGEVLLSLKYLPTSQRLEVGLLKVRTLSQSPNKHRALYARTSVVCNRCNLRHQKTTHKTRWEMTVFNEVMTFALPGPQVTECSIVVSVYEVGGGKRSSKRLIGQASLKKGKRAEDEHWSLMTHSLRQPIAKWHLLLI
ncbi:synaptotagmin-5 isoform X2 [Anguilla anguilla]|nr:synaptotagmin-5 isoform X2 [Anguilla anguilla]